ncbi:MAG TPA: redoxin domain-containing protein [Solirubrobacteraceae bacterium]|nr:redoxin domain-containing protein [Solirubrobacteraceae bacterium]
MHLPRRLRTSLMALAGLAVAALVVAAVVARLHAAAAANSPAAAALAANPTLDPGTPLHGAAPDFTLTDQFGRRMSLSAFRGRVVLLAFNDPVCTTVCPLTTTAMLDAKRLLGAAGRDVALLGVAANPRVTSVAAVRHYSAVHGMTRAWHFLTGPLPVLKRVWHAYGIEAQVVRGQIDHTPALYVISPQGQMSRLYMTQMAYSSVDQLGQLLARSASALLPGRPAVRSSLSYAQAPPIAPARSVVLPRADGSGGVTLGPGHGARLLLFFDTWVLPPRALGAQLDSLDRYASAARRHGLPALTAVDEASVEPSRAALPRLLRQLPRPLAYPVAVDRSGRVADGYEVQDQPWLVLVSATGHFLWYDDVATTGWPSPATLAHQVRAALAHVVTAAPSSVVARLLAGSPPPLNALHRQAGQLLVGKGGLMARLRALHGYPVVINAWASWCPPCQAEFPLFASASARYGRQVAFLGANTNDTPGAARGFLAKHPVSYPSYEATSSQLGPLAAIGGLPTTIFINQSGKVVHVHTGQYDSEGSLDADIQTYAMGTAG